MCDALVRKNLKHFETTVMGTIDNPKRNGGLKRDTGEEEKSKRRGERVTRLKNLIRKHNYKIQAEG